MARAAVKAKQQARAKAQPAKTARVRGRRRHKGGGNPNQQLFFVKLRRGQKWLYALLALVFAVGFAGIGVGSGGGGLSQLYTGLFGGGGGDAVSKAKDEIKTNPAKGYRALATAYESKSENVLATKALRSYLRVKGKDANAWAELGGLEGTQGQQYITRYQSAQQAAQLADPSAPLNPAGALAGVAGPNAAYQTASQQVSALTSQLLQQATTSLNNAVRDYRHATKIRPRNASLQAQLATAAENAGKLKVAIHALQKYLKLDPTSPFRSQVKAQLKQVRKALAQSTAQSTAGKK